MQLALTGIRVEDAWTPDEAEDAVERYLDSDTRILIVEENLLHEFSDALNERLERHVDLPLVVYCPEFEQEDSDVDAYLTAVLKPAIGYEIRLD